MFEKKTIFRDKIPPVRILFLFLFFFLKNKRVLHPLDYKKKAQAHKAGLAGPFTGLLLT
jgi:hypothetical protein